MHIKLLNDWACSNFLHLFFDDIKKVNNAAALPAGFPENIDCDTEQEYTDLFKGTNASISIPLWASLCVNPEGHLLDKTTLDIIEFYHYWGYKPAITGGMPPDYIGEQFRFMCYLHAAALHALREDIQEAIGKFKNMFLLDTAKAVTEGIYKYSSNPLFLKTADIIKDYINDDRNKIEALFNINNWSNGLENLACSNIYHDGLEKRITGSHAKTILTSGRNNCGGRCSIAAVTQEGCLLKLDHNASFNQPGLKPCVLGRNYHKTYMSMERLRYPMQRIGERGEGRFRRITWEQAADIAAEQWIKIRDKYGPSSRYVMYGGGVNAVFRPDQLFRRLLNLDGGHLSYHNSYSTACANYITPYIYGDQYSGNSLEDILNTKFLILWGHNPAETRFGSQRSYYLNKLKELGVKIIAIDPRQSDSAIAFADEWIGIKPSTDGALADAMAYVIWSEGLHDQNFMDTYCLGFDENHMPKDVAANQSYQSYLFGFQDGIKKTPEWAASITGVPAYAIIKLARTYAASKPACILPGLGNQRTGNGEQTVRAMAMLACLTGNVGIPGGGAAGLGFIKEHALPFFPVENNPYPGSIPCFLWTKAVETPGDMTERGDGLKGVEKLDSGIKMIINAASNTLINQHSDINNTIRIIKDESKCEFILCTDVFMTPSAKFADLLLPAASFLEEDSIVFPWVYGHYLLFCNKTVEPLFESRNEYSFIYMLAQKLGLLEKWSGGYTDHTEWLKNIYSDLRKKELQLPEYEEFKQCGGYAYKNTKPYIAYEMQIREPANHKFKTPSGKIEIFSKSIYDMGNPSEIPAIPKYTPCHEGPEDPLTKKYPLQLVGWHSKRRIHTIHDNNKKLDKIEPQAVWMHPSDAEQRGINNNDSVKVFNDRGSITIPVRVTERVIRGVVAIPQGAWFTPGEDGIDRHGSINVLTSTRPTPFAKGNPQHTNLVEVTPIY